MLDGDHIRMWARGPAIAHCTAGELPRWRHLFASLVPENNGVEDNRFLWKLRTLRDTIILESCNCPGVGPWPNLRIECGSLTVDAGQDLPCVGLGSNHGTIHAVAFLACRDGVACCGDVGRATRPGSRSPTAGVCQHWLQDTDGPSLHVLHAQEPIISSRLRPRSIRDVVVTSHCGESIIKSVASLINPLIGFDGTCHLQCNFVFVTMPRCFNCLNCAIGMVKLDSSIHRNHH